ncbi:unnamed protein product [Sphagnum balticum]
MLACQSGNIECVRLLLRVHDIDVNAMNAEHMTALHLATSFEHTDILSLLIEHKADVNTRTDKCETPLMIAAIEGHLECARLLLDTGNIDVNSIVATRFTALHMAAQ